VDLPHHHLIARLSGHLRDAVAHQPSAEHAHLLDLLRHETSASLACVSGSSLYGAVVRRPDARPTHPRRDARGRPRPGAPPRTPAPRRARTRAPDARTQTSPDAPGQEGSDCHGVFAERTSETTTGTCASWRSDGMPPPVPRPAPLRSERSRSGAPSAPAGKV